MNKSLLPLICASLCLFSCNDDVIRLNVDHTITEGDFSLGIKKSKPLTLKANEKITLKIDGKAYFESGSIDNTTLYSIFFMQNVPIVVEHETDLQNNLDVIGEISEIKTNDIDIKKSIHTQEDWDPEEVEEDKNTYIIYEGRDEEGTRLGPQLQIGFDNNGTDKIDATISLTLKNDCKNAYAVFLPLVIK